MKTEFPLLSSLVMNGELPAIPPQCKLVDGQEATDRYWYDENDVWEFSKDFGCMAPPYQFMWIESTAHIPIGAPKNGKVSDERQDCRVGYKLECHNKEAFTKLYGRHFIPGALESADFTWGWVVQVFMDTWTDLLPLLGGSKNRVPALGFLFLDAEGKPTGARTTAFEASVRKDQQQMVRDTVWGPGKAAFFAISMMNCRNVQVEPRQTVTRRGGKKTKRPSKPSVEYHKIHLPAPKTSGSGSGALTGVTKLHTARGHFKTYTEDAPLMGRHVGTYYWGWQVRGNRKNGEVVSSYEVGAA